MPKKSLAKDGGSPELSKFRVANSEKLARQRSSKVCQWRDLCWHDIQTEFMKVVCISEQARG